MFQLRPFQSKLEDELFQSWVDGFTATILVSPTGSGKTVLMSSTARRANEPTVAIAHRQELVQQISMAMARMGIAHNIIAAEKTIKVIISQHVREFGRSFYDTRSWLTVAGVDTLMRNAKKHTQWANTVKLWMIDECFPAGTLVDGRPIETLKVGDFVHAFDDHTGDIRLSRITRLFKNPAPSEMIDIRAGHHVVKSTKGHPFFTQRGWVIASEIKTSDRVLVESLHSMRDESGLDNRNTEIPLAQNGSDILHEQMCLSVSRRKPQTSQAENRGNHMFNLLNEGTSVSFDSEPIQSEQDVVLQSGLFHAVSADEVIRNYGSDEPKIRIGSNDLKQSNALTGVTIKDEEHAEADRTPTVDQGWQRSPSNKSRRTIDGDVGQVGVHRTTHSSNWTVGYGVSDTLQDRLREPEIDDRHRSGRGQSRDTGTSSTGSTERRVLTWQRVDSVEVHKRSDNGQSSDGFVYNIEVDEFHTYIANGIVVHNCHHCLEDNKWGKAIKMFPNARGVGFTASPIRCDRKSLSATQGGVFDAMRVGPSMRELIDAGFLADYRIFGPPQSIDTSGVKISQATGDFSTPSLREAAEQSTITGDIVAHYLRIAPGKRGITFTVDVDSAVRTAQAFRDAGVSAEAVSAKTPDAVRNEVIRKFQNGTILQLVNVDLFGEGFDVPAVEVVSMGRPTQSFGLYLQQFGRALRTSDGKTHGIVIDHVGNVKRHGLPDAVRNWTLTSEESGRRSAQLDPDVMPVTTCVSCSQAYEAITKTCPYCGHVHEPESRGEPKFVDGDLIEFSEELLAELRKAASAIDSDFTPVPAHLRGTPAEGSLVRKHGEAKLAQVSLRESIALWAGVRRDRGMDDSEIYRRFYHTFNTDIATAQGLRAAEATELTTKIQERYWV